MTSSAICGPIASTTVPAVVDNRLVVAGDEHNREIGGGFRRYVPAPLGHHDLRHGGRLGEEAAHHGGGYSAGSDESDLLGQGHVHSAAARGPKETSVV